MKKIICLQKKIVKSYDRCTTVGCLRLCLGKKTKAKRKKTDDRSRLSFVPWADSDRNVKNFCRSFVFFSINTFATVAARVHASIKRVKVTKKIVKSKKIIKPGSYLFVLLTVAVRISIFIMYTDEKYRAVCFCSFRNTGCRSFRHVV